MKQKIYRYLAPLHGKMGLQKILELAMLHLVIVGTLSLTVFSCTKFMFFPRYMDFIKGIAILFLLCFPTHVLLRFPNKTSVIRNADSLYFKERLVTSLEFDGRGGQAIEEQRADTLKKMEEIKVEKLYKLSFPKRLAAILCVLFICHLGLFFIENQNSRRNADAAREKKEVTESLEKLQKKLAEKRAEKGADQGLEEKLAKTLEGKLQGVENREDAIKALSMTKNELSELFSEQEKQKLADSLKEIDKSAKELAGGTLSDYAFQDEKNEKAKGENTKDGETEREESELAHQGEQADKFPGASEDSSGAAGGDAGTGNSKNSGAESGNFEQGRQQSSKEGERKPSDGSDKSESSSEESEGTPGEDGAPSSEGAGNKSEGNSQNQGNNGQDGNANGNGKNAKSTEGGGAFAQQEGSQNGQNSPGSGKDGSGSGHGGKGRGRGAGKDEIMIDPKRLHSQEKNRFVPSQKAGENEDSSYQRAKTMPKETGEVKDYQKLFAEYAKEANFTGKELKIPNGMQGIVKSYFESIQN